MIDDVALAILRAAMSRDDARIAAIARMLAEALRDVAYTCKDEDKKRVAVLHMELCRAVKEEEDNGQS